MEHAAAAVSSSDAATNSNNPQRRIKRLKQENGALQERVNKLKRERQAKRQATSDQIDAVLATIANIQKTFDMPVEIIRQPEFSSSLIKRIKIQEAVDLRKSIEFVGCISTSTIMIMGGVRDNLFLDEIWSLSEDKTSWIKIPLRMPVKTAAGGAAHAHEELYIFGGFHMEKSLYKLDKSSFKWIQLGDMNEERVGITNSSLEWNRSIWVVGGYNANEALKSVERYDTLLNKWIKMPSMNYARTSAAATVWNNKLFICGGRSNTKKSLNSLDTVEYYDPDIRIWAFLVNMPSPCYGHSLICYENRLILAGGYNATSPLNSVHSLASLKEEWKKLSDVKYAGQDFGAVVLGKELYLIGGRRGKDELHRVEILYGREGWRDGPFLPWKCFSIAAIVIPQNLADSLSHCPVISK